MFVAWKKSYDQPRQCIEKQIHHFANKGPSSQIYGFSSSHAWMWELNHKKAKGWRTDAFELWCWGRCLRVPWTARRSTESILKEINISEYAGRTDAEAEAPILWPPDAKSQLIGKGPDAGKDWGQCKASAEKKRASWGVRQEKGNLLEGKERVSGP